MPIDLSECEVVHIESGDLRYNIILTPGALERHAASYAGDAAGSIAQSVPNRNMKKLTEA